MNEIRFLRELKMCENVVSLERVYLKRDTTTGTIVLSLVMIFAKYGSLL